MAVSRVLLRILALLLILVGVLLLREPAGAQIRGVTWTNHPTGIAIPNPR
jgi:hypothetical protein